MRKTKIVATIGPASREPQVLAELIAAGVDVVRLNFSHGTHEDHRKVIVSAREIAGRQGRVPIELRTGDRLAITTDETVEGRPGLISTTYDPLPRDVTPGDTILLDDGNMELRVESVEGDNVITSVVDGGLLKPNKGMNLPGVKLSTPALTEKDRRDLEFGVSQGVDYVALSFVRQAADVEETKALIRSLGGTQPVIAKIEKREAISDLPSILEATDGVMVARGDLGVELSTEEVPTLQKRIIEMANGAGRAVITATQMLESMIENPRPTRAEASDVANAILDGTDAIMLSAETATGKFPLLTVETMARIALYTEQHYDSFRGPSRVSGGSTVARSLARVANTVAEELDCKLIVAFTESGTTARLVSAYRPRAPIAAITPNDETWRRLALCWGVVPLKSAFAPDTDAMILQGEGLLKSGGLARSGDTILMLAGQTHSAGATNMLRVHTIS